MLLCRLTHDSSEMGRLRGVLKIFTIGGGEEIKYGANGNIFLSGILDFLQFPPHVIFLISNIYIRYPQCKCLKTL